MKRPRYWASYLNTVVTDAAALGIAAAVVPGTTMSWRGFLIAFGIIVGPEISLGVYTTSKVPAPPDDHKRLLEFGAGCGTALIWIFAGPLVADWATSGFNIGGWWQYLILLALILAPSEVCGWAYGLSKRGRARLAGEVRVEHERGHAERGEE